jgi:hypothetical protein
MFSSNKNIETIRLLLEEAKRYFDLQKKYVRLDATEKMTMLLSAMTLGAILLLIGTIVLFYLSVTAALYLGDLIGSRAGAFGIITLALALLFAIVYACRRKLIIEPMTRFLAGIFLSEDNDEKEEKETLDEEESK